MRNIARELAEILRDERDEAKEDPTVNDQLNKVVDYTVSKMETDMLMTGIGTFPPMEGDPFKDLISDAYFKKVKR